MCDNRLGDLRIGEQALESLDRSGRLIQPHRVVTSAI
jgi:hypothetical protein